MSRLKRSKKDLAGHLLGPIFGFAQKHPLAWVFVSIPLWPLWVISIPFSAIGVAIAGGIRGFMGGLVYGVFFALYAGVLYLPLLGYTIKDGFIINVSRGE